jgi:carbonic anhydrase
MLPALLLLGLLFLSTVGANAPFSYSGETGPEFWGTLDPAYLDCDNPTNDQSPRDLVVEDVVVNPPDLAELEIEEIPKGTFKFENLGFTVQVEVKNTGETLSGGGLLTGYELTEFHYHVPSEHTINGAQFPLELQMVHKNAEGELAVLAVLFELTPAPNKFLDSHFDDLDEIPFKGFSVDVDLEPYSVLRGFNLPLSYYQYRGSLTNPPCTQVVRWFILTELAGVSIPQLATITALLGNQPNNRPPQTNDNPVRSFVPASFNSYF